MLYHCDHLTFKIISVNRIKNKKGRVCVGGRPFHALAFRCSGNGRFLLPNGQRLYSGEKNIFFMSADMPYEVEYTDGETLVVHFLSQDYKTTAENYDFQPSARLIYLFEEIFKQWQKQECIYAINALFYQILHELRKAGKENCLQEPFFQAVEYLETRFNEQDLSIAKICRECGISTANFRLKFGRVYGVSPIAYLTRLRIGYGLRLLSDKTFTVEQAAQECGFSDGKYFSRIIKKNYGISPLRLAKKISME